MRAVSLGLVLVLGASQLVYADGEKILKLKNGRTIRGEIKDETPTNYIVKVAGGDTTVPKSLVASVEDAPPPEKNGFLEPEPPKTKAPDKGPTTTEPDKGPGTTKKPSSDTPPPPPSRTDPKEDRSHDDMDEKGLMPAWARVGGSTEPVEGKNVSPQFKEALDHLLEGTTAPEDITAWIKEKAPFGPDLDYVAHLMQTWARNPNERRALWLGWVAAEREDRAEERLLPFATSDLWVTRLEALNVLQPYATWEKSLPSFLKLMDVGHLKTLAAIEPTLVALVRRSPPKDEVVSQLIAHHRNVKYTLSRESYFQVLSTCCEVGSQKAATYVLGLYKAMPAKDRPFYLRKLLNALEKESAHRLCLDILREDDEASQIQWPDAARALARVGSPSDISVVLGLTDRRILMKPDGTTPVGGTQIETLVLEVVGRLARHDRWEKLDDAKVWWESVRDTYDRLDSLMGDLRGGGSAAFSALASLEKIRSPELDELIRSTALGASDGKLRAEACNVIMRHEDRKGVPSVLEAFKRADKATRESVGGALRGLAKGKIVPLTNPAETLNWWRDNFPDDFN